MYHYLLIILPYPGPASIIQLHADFRVPSATLGAEH